MGYEGIPGFQGVKVYILLASLKLYCCPQLALKSSHDAISRVKRGQLEWSGVKVQEESRWISAGVLKKYDWNIKKEKKKTFHVTTESH